MRKPMTTNDSFDATLAVEAFHREVDTVAAKLEAFHAERLTCARGCAGCCVDDIRVFEVEAQLIRTRHRAVLQAAAHPVGACAFLDEAGACRIYADRPYVCRTQGLPLRWIDDEQQVEHRDICHLNEAGPLITDLKPGQCWTLGPAEAKLQAIQLTADRSMPRVSLRQLFDESG